MSDAYYWQLVTARHRPMAPRRRHRADMLTLRDKAGEYVYETLYSGYDQARRRDVREAAHAAGQTHVWIDPHLAPEYQSHLRGKGLPAFDLFDQPEAMAEVCKELYEDGLWPYLVAGLEQAPDAIVAKYRQPDRFEAAVVALVSACRPWIAGIMLGVEVKEWSREDWILGYARAIKAVSPDVEVAVHFHGGEWGWPGRQTEFWRAAGNTIDVLNYQSGFDFQENNDLAGFISDLTARRDLMRSRFNKFVRAAEYAHPRRGEWPEAGRAAWELLALGYGNG